MICLNRRYFFGVLLIFFAARAIRAEELSDATVVPELEKQGRCNF